MDGLALLGIVLILYAALVMYIALKKPPTIWEMGKIKAFRKVLGDKGTVVLFALISVIAVGFGIWMVVK